MERGGGTLRLGKRTTAAVRLLDLCPLIPVDAFSHLAGLRSASGAYRILGKLRRAGLVDVERVDVGYLVADRPLGLWRLTEHGWRACVKAQPSQTGSGGTMFPVAGQRSEALRHTNLTLLVATYRLLACLVAERSADGKQMDVRSWERPWLRVLSCSDENRKTYIRLPAGALLEAQLASTNIAIIHRDRISVVLVPDLGAAPVARHREMLRRLHAFCETGTDLQPQVVVATVDPDRNGARTAAWARLLESIARKSAQRALFSRVVSWDEVATVLARGPLPLAASEQIAQRHTQVACDRRSGPERRAPARTRQQVMHLVGRHPLLSVKQVAALLGLTTTRIRRLEGELVENGWLRRIQYDELPHGHLALGCEEFTRLGLVELTLAGRRRLATLLGLDSAAATRYHGLISNGRTQAGRRRRLLDTFAHTLGANDIFVELATAAERCRRVGGTDELAEWRSAAACERGRCKPDGYGCYVRHGLKYGFFLEYDRGTESRRQYAAKFRAYYRYRDSGQAQRDYDGFPTLLCITIDPAAEYRIAEEAYRAWAIRDCDPLPVLVTTTQRIDASGEGIIGRIWRTPAPGDWSDSRTREYWLSDCHPPRAAGAGWSVRCALPFQNSSARQSNGAEQA